MTNFCKDYQKIKISEDVIKATLAFGQSDKSAIDKRFCVFFCSQLLQIENMNNPEIIKAFVSLHNENEKNVRREIGFQIRFIVKEKDVTFFIKNFLNIIYLYLDDSDVSIRCETIISSIKNLDKVYDDDNFLKKLINATIDLLQNDKITQKDCLTKASKIVKTILLESMQTIKIAQILEKVVKVVINV